MMPSKISSGNLKHRPQDVWPRFSGASPAVWMQFIFHCDAIESGEIELAEDFGPFFALFDRLARAGVPFVRAVAALRRLVILADPDQENDVGSVIERQPRAVSSDTAAAEWMADVLIQRGWTNGVN